MEKSLAAIEENHRASPELAPPPSPGGHRRSKATEIKFGPPRAFLGHRFVYAVISQRARGLTIGVNMNPDKFCNFACTYCEVNRDVPARDKRVNLEVLAAELESVLTLAFQDKLRELSYFKTVPAELMELKEVALSGDGEPTLSEDFVEVVREVVHIRSLRHFPFFKIVLNTNTSGLDRPEVRAGLKHLTSEDEIWAKLDGGTQEYMDKVNGARDMTLHKVMHNILLIGRERPIVIQSLFPLINGLEPTSEEIEEYVQRLKELKDGGAKISLVQIYSAHRAPNRPNCAHVPLKCLSRISQRVREVTRLPAEVF